MCKFAQINFETSVADIFFIDCLKLISGVRLWIHRSSYKFLSSAIVVMGLIIRSALLILL